MNGERPLPVRTECLGGEADESEEEKKAVDDVDEISFDASVQRSLEKHPDSSTLCSDEKMNVCKGEIELQIAISSAPPPAHESGDGVTEVARRTGCENEERGEDGAMQSHFQQPAMSSVSLSNSGSEQKRPTDAAVAKAEISELASDRKGFGLALVLLGFIRTGRALLPLTSLDLSGFSLDSRKLKHLLSSLPSGPGFVETLRCGPRVCKDSCLPVFLDFLCRLKAGGTGAAPCISLKTLNLAKCDLGEAAVGIFLMLPQCLEHLILSENRLRSVSMEGLASVLSFGWLPHLLSLDLSDNPLGPSGLKALAKGLLSSPLSLPLQSLKLARTKAKAEGMQALADALKIKKTTSLQTLDLEGNEMRPAGLKHLASAVNAEAVPRLRVLILKGNSLVCLAFREMDYTPLNELLSTSSLKELEELDLSENMLFDGEEIGGPGTSDQLSAAVIAVPGRFPKLKRLDLGKGNLSWMNSWQLGALATALGVGRLPSLQDLVIPPWRGDRGNPEAVVAFANALSSGHLPKLRDLHVSVRTDVRGKALASLTRSLVTGKTSLLQNLVLSMSCDCAEGLGALAEGIWGKKLSLLASFKLYLNDVSGFALSGLGLALGGGGCPRLQKLHLKWWEEGDQGVAGVAEGLSSGGMSCLQDLSLEVKCSKGCQRDWGGEGCSALGEVLSRGKVPSLRTVSLVWQCDQSLSSLCEGLSRGRIDPPVLLDMHLLSGRNSDLGLITLAGTIRAGKLSGLRKFHFESFGPESLRREGGGALGEALTHADAPLNSLEKLYIPSQRAEVTAAFLEGLSRGPGSLPALHSLSLPCVGGEGARSLSALVSSGRVPALTSLRLILSGVGQAGMQHFAAAVGPANASAEVGVFSEVLTSGHLHKLGELRVEGIREIEEVSALCVGLGSGKLSSLRVLGLRDSLLDETEAVRALSEVLVAEKLPNLRALEVGMTNLSTKGVEALVESWMSRDPPPLEHVDLGLNQLTGSVVNPLLRLLGSQRLSALETLRVDRNFEMDKRVQALFEAFPEVVEI
uniref:Uncharacterized protein n=1 Tax=Chromera velia CCMP2878 TaxID=1169474 RepID=A0A0G4G0L5_9ALVE|eukprot:Cvel_19672.t1-p1 / transcript=Cvel_19672.t1 / gene=Cvel_19672 / organism=Chromera_velia_CCMP2878 / gene_product=hypothetical protein / transcript_product=hypothetical protein / location=Cvel_scaffold1715:50-9092(+) / protein_length=1027 / sequence_SO=supercontig / SO=protein_coding / is_pseudo=false